MATALETLLARLASERAAPLPDPAAPMSLGPLSTDTSAAFAAQNPEPVPPAFVAPRPVDAGFVGAYSGPEPTRPVQSQPGLLEKLSTILLGVGSGLQGNAPQYIEQVRRQRNAPIEAYERQRREFEDRRTRALEIDERRARDEATQANRTAEQQYERDFQVWLKKTGVRDEVGKAAMRQVYELEQIRERERVADEKLERRNKAQQERDARLIARDFGKVGAKPEIALQLGRYYSGLVDEISPQAAQFESAQARLAEARLRRAATGGGSGGGTSAKAQKAADEINSINQKMAEAEARGDQQTVKQLITRAKAAIRNAARFPDIEAGFDPTGKWPYAKPRGGQIAQPAAAAPPLAGPVMAEPPPETVQAYMQRFGITDRNQAIQELMGQQ